RSHTLYPTKQPPYPPEPDGPYETKGSTRESQCVRGGVKGDHRRATGRSLLANVKLLIGRASRYAAVKQAQFPDRTLEYPTPVFADRPDRRYLAAFWQATGAARGRKNPDYI